MHITKGEIYLKKICSLNLKYSRVCVCVCETERTRRRERENERVQPEIAIHTNKLPRKKRPACPPPSLRHCCPPFVHPFVCVHWMHLVRFICFYYHFRPSLHSFFFLILWGLLRDGNPGSKMRWWISSLPFRQCGTRLWNAWSWRQCSAICNKNVYK